MFLCFVGWGLVVRRGGGTRSGRHAGRWKGRSVAELTFAKTRPSLPLFRLPLDDHILLWKNLSSTFPLSDPHATMNPWPPSSSSSSFHPSSAAPSSPGYHSHPPPRPPSVASSSHHGHHHTYIAPPKPLDSVDIAEIKETFQDLAIAAPNVCKWIPPPLRGIDDTAESTAFLEMRQQHPGETCGRILASGIILNDVSRENLPFGVQGKRAKEEGRRRGC